MIRWPWRKPAPPIEAAAEPDIGEMLSDADMIVVLRALVASLGEDVDLLTEQLSALAQRVQVIEAHEHGAKASIV